MKKVLIVFWFFILQGILVAQDKIPMDHYVYDSWKQIRENGISNNGNFVFYVIKPQKGDGQLSLYNCRDNSVTVYPRAYNAKFSFESDFFAAKIQTPWLLTRQAKKDKLKKDEFPKDSLMIVDLKTGICERYENVRNYSLPQKGGEWMVFHHSWIPEKKEDKRKETEKSEKKKGEEKFRQIQEKLKAGDLVILNLTEKISFRYENIVSYNLSDNGRTVVFSQIVKDSIPSSVVYSFDTRNENLQIIYEGIGLVEQLVTDSEGQQSSFLFSADTSRVSGLDLHYWKQGNEHSIVIADSSVNGLDAGWGVNRYGKIYFSGDGNRLFFGTSQLLPVEPEDTLLKEERPSLDVWSWNDLLLQPMQKNRLNKEKKRSYLCLYSIPEKEFVQLGNRVVRDVVTMDKGNGDQMMGISREKYGKLISWEGTRFKDIYTINPHTGEKQLVLEKLPGNAHLSPAGKYLLYWMRVDSSWYVFDIEKSITRNLTTDLGLPFYDEWNDKPQLPGNYGFAGFTEDDSYVLIYDRYDLWKFDPSGKEKATCLTLNSGRGNNQIYRYIKTDKEELYISLDKEIYLRVENEITHNEGIAILDAEKESGPKMLIESPDHYHSLKKAKNTEVFIYRKGNFKDYPDLYLSEKNFGKPRKISNTNPQSSEYLWGDVQQVHWESFNGDQLNGLLYTPENMNPEKKYPMLVYFYERSSSGIHMHTIPSPSRSIINIPWCTSNGYVVFVPDIVYRNGYPGESAYDAVISGTRAMTERYDFIDSDHMGIQGQSWGGYQVAFLVTRTNMFAAAMAGAPVSNMTSAYGGMRWKSGMSRMFQYEKTQSRIGGSLWEKPLLYMENSPLFYVPRIQTPLLIMHNDNDGAVPWYQGIEFFVALRRLNKPSWMLTYNNEEHNLKKWPNRVDLSIRMMQFFDYYLKEGEEPDWMKYGVTQSRKGEQDGLRLLN